MVGRAAVERTPREPHVQLAHCRTRGLRFAGLVVNGPLVSRLARYGSASTSMAFGLIIRRSYIQLRPPGQRKRADGNGAGGAGFSAVDATLTCGGATGAKASTERIRAADPSRAGWRARGISQAAITTSIGTPNSTGQRCA